MGASWLVGLALAAATPQTGNAPVDGFIADLAAGRRDAALGRILEMNSMSGEANAVAFAHELVDKLVRCTATAAETSRFHREMYEISWRCRDGAYFLIVDPNYRPPRIVVAEFVSAVERLRRRQNRTVPAVPMVPRLRSGPYVPPPAPSAEEKQRIALAYVEALRGSGAISRPPYHYLVRFADGRPNGYITPEQLRIFLAPCRTVRTGVTPSSGTIVLLSCNGPRALDPFVALQLAINGRTVDGGMVLVGLPPGEPTIRSPQ